jgi:hypothetical protein
MVRLSENDPARQQPPGLRAKHTILDGRTHHLLNRMGAAPGRVPRRSHLFHGRKWLRRLACTACALVVTSTAGVHGFVPCFPWSAYPIRHSKHPHNSPGGRKISPSPHVRHWRTCHPVRVTKITPISWTWLSSGRFTASSASGIPGPNDSSPHTSNSARKRTRTPRRKAPRNRGTG